MTLYLQVLGSVFFSPSPMGWETWENADSDNVDLSVLERRISAQANLAPLQAATSQMGSLNLFA